MEHKTAYAQWLESVNNAIIASGGRSLFSFARNPIKTLQNGEIPEEKGDPMAAEVEAIMERAGIKPFRFYQ